MDRSAALHRAQQHCIALGDKKRILHNTSHHQLQQGEYSRSHCPQVCPASWRPGKATMKPDPVGSQEYFKTLPQ
jgi:hypothetical protein